MSIAKIFERKKCLFYINKTNQNFICLQLDGFKTAGQKYISLIIIYNYFDKRLIFCFTGRHFFNIVLLRIKLQSFKK